MAEPEWELLNVRGLGMTDERAAEFVGTFVIHRAGSAGTARVAWRRSPTGVKTVIVAIGAPL